MADTPSSCDVAVIGLGAMGAAALYQLARRGVKAVGIDRFSPPHDQGSTHGETRITRQGIGEGAQYSPLALRSHEVWRELEAETGRSLLVACGCLVVASKEFARPTGLRADFLTQTRQAAERYGIAHEMLSADEIRRRFPHFAPRDHEIGYFEPGGGYARPEECIAAQLDVAGRMGARTILGTVVREVRPEGGSVRIVTDRGEILAGQAIVAAGAWAPGLMGEAFEKVLTPMRQVMHWYALDPAWENAWERGPVFIWQHGKGAGQSFYGFPSIPGSHTMKTATEQYEASVDPDRVERAIDPEEPRLMYERHVAGRFNGVRPESAKSLTCLYTVTPDSDFVIDRHPDHDRILVVSPCSGHGFKHSAAIGESAAEVVAEGRSRIDLSGFAMKRFDSLALAGGVFNPAMQA
ncbi:N-methyl-L-tryptophan oxidase [Microvirga pudoricolor]|uniref:N-methyl-L-tryptophan oxidase n=1 Tax=Microvirga pudoricolor TaxID=2778729 RepID=UPI00194E0BC2|nr:N-methyl-L-tryptophan oxidase [Microvirga pudoricolor]MBM6593316.1 N-methyl-L-tryptophan oxidase [Microvirga pudoricolor]